MNADEPPEVNCQTVPEDGQNAAPLGGKVKNFLKRNWPKVVVVGGAVVVVVVALALQPDEEQSVTGYAEGAEGTDSAADSAVVDERRKPPVKHEVAGHTRTLADGRVIPVSGYERGGSFEDDNPSEAAV
ncbi:hypothetical protein [Actinacidiphila sp. bgisy167]|uniref:hypothetical protein n=1 Tax=Actinacidiphila sp. bgisy167 TaxID=3413797 RepID=UPI003D7644B4